MAQKPPDLDDNLKPIIEKPPDLDHTGAPITTQPSDVSVTIGKSPDEPVADRQLAPEEENQLQSGLSKFWHSQTEPLVKLDPTTEAAMSSYQHEHPIIGGIGNAIVHTMLGLSSPLNLEMGATGLGELGALKAGLPKIAQALSYGTKALSVPVAAEGAINTFGPNKTLPERLTGGLEMLGGIAGLRHKLPEIADSIASPEATRYPGMLMADEIPSASKKPSLRLQQDGSLIDKATGEIVYDPASGKPLPADKSNKFQLPPDLKNAKPRFNMGNTSYQPNFESDLDKALYIIAQKTPSKRDADYLSAITDHTGMDENQARGAGIDVRRQIKSLVKGQEGGPINIPPIHEAQQTGNIPLQGDASTTRPQFNPKRQKGLTGSAQKPPDIEPEKLTTKVDPRTQALIDNRHIGDVVDKRQKSIIKEAMNLPRGIMASYDLSAPGRQGLPLIANKEWWTSWGDMVKSLGSEAAFKDVQKSIADKPLFKNYGNGSFAEKVGLHLSDLTNLSSREEQLMSTWAEKIPGVRASNRAYTAYLNKLRADTFERMMEDAKTLGNNGEYNMPLSRSIADFVNTATGRGSLGSLEKYATELNSVFFSPRLIASRLKLLNPQYYWAAEPYIRQQAVKSLFAVAGAGTLVSQLGKLAGGKVESNPTSSDFGKLKIGDTRIDPYGGFQQYIVLANRLLQNKTKSSVSGKEQELGKKFGSPSRMDILENFGESKLNPALSLAVGILKGKDVSGKPYNVPEQVAQRFIPLFLQDLKTVATQNPNLIPGYHDIGLDQFNPERMMLATPGAFGAGIQNYPSR